MDKPDFSARKVGLIQLPGFDLEPQPVEPNPMVKLHGPGPDDATCGQCQHLKGVSYSKTYWKCSQRADLTKGAKTDQRKGWKACGLFQALADGEKSKTYFMPH